MVDTARNFMSIESLKRVIVSLIAIPLLISQITFLGDINKLIYDRLGANVGKTHSFPYNRN